MRGKDVLEVAKFPKVIYKGKGSTKGAGLEFEGTFVSTSSLLSNGCFLQGTMMLKGTEKPLSINSVITVEADNKGRPYFVMKVRTFPPPFVVDR